MVEVKEDAAFLHSAEGSAAQVVELFFFQAEDGIRDVAVTGVQTCALPILRQAEQRGLAGEVFAPLAELAKQQGAEGIHALDNNTVRQLLEENIAAEGAASKGKIGRASCRERV